jgi:hypothetical protein
MRVDSTNLKKEFIINIISDGFKIFPCDSNKKPLMDVSNLISFSLDYTKNLLSGDNLTWENAISFNNAIICGNRSNLLILDIDKKSGGLFQWYNILKIFNNSEDIKTFKVKTANKGYHYYFKIDESCFCSWQTHFSLNLLNNFLTGIDLIANNGYVIMPYSIGLNGEIYLPLNYNPSKALNEQISYIPTWLKDLINDYLKNKEFLNKLS